LTQGTTFISFAHLYLKSTFYSTGEDEAAFINIQIVQKDKGLLANARHDYFRKARLLHRCKTPVLARNKNSLPLLPNAAKAPVPAS
jgi:hypothetical protein